MTKAQALNKLKELIDETTTVTVFSASTRSYLNGKADAYTEAQRIIEKIER